MCGLEMMKIETLVMKKGFENLVMNKGSSWVSFLEEKGENGRVFDWKMVS